MRPASLLLLLTSWWPMAGHAAGDVPVPVAHCYERLLERVPKRTAYSALLANETQLAAARVERGQAAFSARIAKPVSLRVRIEGNARRNGQDFPVWLKCGYQGDTLVTWEIEKRRG
ncbi:hypothetical protein N8I74_11255 [Chitiniphilus purpureus]|uniref:Uncharacterized protein n=1 Tax=Chitiniphilus purpureus TaxID=2981137 RepID=A0ABY6DHS8_9NEIS|nr:hypothetical protein [Chitiniphilus sp. CD1]UXY13899.1 hypothetical protein N8I74_11255 [Chitiniphilus sp. CD1]